nr:hypothetical protein [Tanacetum cinerariifolium]
MELQKVPPENPSQDKQISSAGNANVEAAFVVGALLCTGAVEASRASSEETCFQMSAPEDFEVLDDDSHFALHLGLSDV